MSKRFPGNTNLHLYEGEFYKGFELVSGHSPFIEEYLDGTLSTIQRALSIYPRLLAIRVDLRYPYGYGAFANERISRFFDSLKSKVEHDRSCAQRDLKRAHDTEVYYVWAKEYGVDETPHYHCVLLLNHDAYFTLGSFNSTTNNMYNRITEAWASALGMSYDDVKGLAHIPEKGVYRINARDGDMAIAALFRRCSYFCKAATKRFDGRGKAFSCSQFNQKHEMQVRSSM